MSMEKEHFFCWCMGVTMSECVKSVWIYCKTFFSGNGDIIGSIIPSHTHISVVLAREHLLLLHLYFPPRLLPRAFLLHSDSEEADSPQHSPLPPTPPPSIYLLRVQKLHSTGKKNDGGWEGCRKKREKKREGGRYKHTLQIQLHTRGWDTHACTHTNTHTLLVEHLNHISWLSVIHHSHRQKSHAREAGKLHGNMHNHPQTNAVTEQPTHLETRQQRAGESNPSLHTIFPNQKSTCIHLHGHHCQHTSTVHLGDPLILLCALLLLCALGKLALTSEKINNSK